MLYVSLAGNNQRCSPLLSGTISNFISRSVNIFRVSFRQRHPSELALAFANNSRIYAGTNPEIKCIYYAALIMRLPRRLLP